MKLVIQIPCYNEAENLPETLLALPRRIDGFDCIEYLIVDDGSRDGTGEVARRWGVHHVVRHRRNRGLAAAFSTGLAAALEVGADIIVNTDADNQYDGRDIAAIVAPLLAGEADIVVGDRGVAANPHFGPVKRRLQKLGSFIVQTLSGSSVPDAVSGFRAMSREAAERINITSTFSYTTEMLIQAGRKRMAIMSVPVRTNGAVRPSRLFRSIPHFIANTVVTMARAYAMYNPLRVFAAGGAICALVGIVPILRFLWFYIIGQGTGHLQSLVLGGALLTLGLVTAMLGVIADLIGRNRQLTEIALEKLRRIEHRLDNAASGDVADDNMGAADDGGRTGTDG